MDAKKGVPVLTRLESACSELKTLLNSTKTKKIEKILDGFEETIENASKRVATKALDTRITRAVSPALSLLDSFKLAESLLRKLIDLSSKLSNENSPETRLKRLKKYVNCVKELNSAINSTSQDSEPAIQKLEEVVEFLNRTKGSDRNQIQWLREILNTLKELYENEANVMRFDGLLDEALLNLQDEYEGILLELRHENIGVQDAEDDDVAEYELGSELEVDVLREISETLVANDCLDICIDIFVKLYQKQAWGPLVKLLAKDDETTKALNKEAIGAMTRGKLEDFMNGFNEMSQKHRSSYTIPDSDLREQIREATISYVVPAYTEFMNTYVSVLSPKSYPSPGEVEELMVQMFGRPREVMDYRRSKSNSGD